MRGLLLLLPLLLVACGQDPLKDEPEYIRYATPPQQKVEEELPFFPSDALVLNMSPGIANFTEGVETKVKFTGETAYDLPYEIKIDRLPVGASFDSTTGEMTWTPPAYFIAGENFHDTQELRVRIVTTEKPIVEKVVTYNLHVYRAIERPSINPIVDAWEVKEGKYAIYTVMVRDIDAVDAAISRNKIPSMVVVPSDNLSLDGSAFVKVIPSTTSSPNPVQDTTDVNLWTFKVRVDLSGQEVTTNSKDMEVGFRVSSGFRLVSDVMFKKFKAVNETSAPASTMTGQTIRGGVGMKNTLYFNVYSTKGDGVVEVIPGDLASLEGFQMSCENSAPGVGSMKTCKMEWVPTRRSSRFIRYTITNTDAGVVKSVDVTNTFSAENMTAPVSAPDQAGTTAGASAAAQTVAE